MKKGKPSLIHGAKKMKPYLYLEFGHLKCWHVDKCSSRFWNTRYKEFIVISLIRSFFHMPILSVKPPLLNQVQKNEDCSSSSRCLWPQNDPKIFPSFLTKMAKSSSDITWTCKIFLRLTAAIFSGLWMKSRLHYVSPSNSRSSLLLLFRFSWGTYLLTLQYRD